MATIKTVAKFICQEYGLNYDEVILKIYNDENNTCLPTIREERTFMAQDLRQTLENTEEPKSLITEDPDEELSFDPKDFIEEIQDDSDNKAYKCIKCNKEYKKLGKSIIKHVQICMNQ
tara:strand:+ start:614 stop:967 length:354 start_codon:yes stop_codon:yes gene_type:complete